MSGLKRADPPAGLAQGVMRVLHTLWSRLLAYRERIFYNGLTAILAGIELYYLLGAFPFFPPGWILGVILGVSLIWLIKPGAGVLSGIIVLFIPVVYLSPTLGLLFILLVLLLSIIDIALLRPYNFLLLGGSSALLAASDLGWILVAVPLLAGMAGVRRGAALAALNCLWLHLLGILAGKWGLIGIIDLGQSAALISPFGDPLRPFHETAWFNALLATRKLDAGLLGSLFTPFKDQPALLMQIAIWTAGAAAVAWLIDRRFIRKIPEKMTALASGWVIMAGGQFLILELFGLRPVAPGLAFLYLTLAALIVGLAAPFLRWAALGPGSQAGAYRFRRAAHSPAVGGKPLHPADQAVGESSSRQGSSGGMEKTAARRVFLSYSSRDKEMVEAICEQLERGGLCCWMAPRDIRPGEDWPAAIAHAIASSQVMLLLFTKNANQSDEVSRELYLAANNRLVIIPFRLDHVEPEPGKAYYLSRLDWMVGENPPTREQVEGLKKLIEAAYIRSV